jgi:hypothetical protein
MIRSNMLDIYERLQTELAPPESSTFEEKVRAAAAQRRSAQKLRQELRADADQDTEHLPEQERKRERAKQYREIDRLIAKAGLSE